MWIFPLGFFPNPFYCTYEYLLYVFIFVTKLVLTSGRIEKRDDLKGQQNKLFLKDKSGDNMWVFPLSFFLNPFYCTNEYVFLFF